VKTRSVAEFVVEFPPAANIKRPVGSIAMEVAAIPDWMARGELEIGFSAPVSGAIENAAICGAAAALDAPDSKPET
jgi:hypothetical protein